MQPPITKGITLTIEHTSALLSCTPCAEWLPTPSNEVGFPWKQENFLSNQVTQIHLSQAWLAQKWEHPFCVELSLSQKEEFPFFNHSCLGHPLGQDIVLLRGDANTSFQHTSGRRMAKDVVKSGERKNSRTALQEMKKWSWILFKRLDLIILDWGKLSFFIMITTKWPNPTFMWQLAFAIKGRSLANVNQSWRRTRSLGHPCCIKICSRLHFFECSYIVTGDNEEWCAMLQDIFG